MENFNPDDKVQFVIDALYAIAHGLQAPLCNILLVSIKCSGENIPIQLRRRWTCALCSFKLSPENGRRRYSIVPTLFAVIGICSTVAVIVLYSRNHDTAVAKASGRELSYVILVTMIMCYAMTFVLIFKPTIFNCALKRTCVGFAFSCLYASLLVKTKRGSPNFFHIVQYHNQYAFRLYHRVSLEEDKANKCWNTEEKANEQNVKTMLVLVARRRMV
ncbi:hypothetical protein LOAG_17752 [Loa loa]|uniref:G-protein coupled receptors family 3 profile domain-containing protein n=1 Tax=Loa loa TaxID=7209 RepID=A0A1S0UI33_LOALO|nr:hypothetical protein LOAG_17752 [Loa loa]EJD75028.1 hypothetical protein LOAG_17752 [Loa loa]